MSKGFGSNSKNFAVIFAKEIGRGNKILFFPIKFNYFLIISLNVKISGPTHSIILE